MHWLLAKIIIEDIGILLLKQNNKDIQRDGIKEEITLTTASTIINDAITEIYDFKTQGWRHTLKIYYTKKGI